MDYRIPIGFELALGHKAQYHLNVDLENATLQDVLNELVGQESDYRVAFRAELHFDGKKQGVDSS